MRDLYREANDIPRNITNGKGKIVLGRKGHGEGEHLDLGASIPVSPQYSRPN